MFENIFKINTSTNWLSRIASPYRHLLGEAQGREVYRLQKKYAQLIQSMVEFAPTSSGERGKMYPEKKLDREVWVMDHPIFSSHSKGIRECIEALIPWRKGPYRLGDHFIDSEWDSSIKWNRLLPHLRNWISQDSVVADLGCNNGYFIFRLVSELSPQTVIGFEPIHRNALQYFLLSMALPTTSPTLERAYLLLGYEALGYFPQGFDVILCLGILYHHYDPIGILKLILSALKPGGKVVIDCQGIPGEKSSVLFPQSRYAGKRNFWFLPTTVSLIDWVKRAGFSKVEVWGEYPLLKEEQRVTEMAPGTSLAEGLTAPEAYYTGAPNVSTVEGYPAPVRIYLGATV